MWVFREAMPLEPTGHLLHYAMLPRQGIISALPKAYKQAQGGCQNEETKRHGPNERTEQNSRRRMKQNVDKQSTRCRVQNTGYKDAQGT